MTTANDHIATFLRTHYFGVMATIRRDGRPQTTAVYCYYDGARLLSSTTRTRAKYHNLRRDPRVTFCVLDPQPPYRYVTVYGRAHIVEDDEQVVELTRQIRSARGAPVPPDLADELRREQRVVVVITPERFVSGA